MSRYSNIEKIDSKIAKIFSNPLVPLAIIFLSGFLLRLYFTPFDLPSRSQDAFYFILYALSFQDTGNIGGRYFMWSGLLALVFSPFHFADYEGYFTIIRLVSISISSLSSLVLYLIAKQIMSKKFALLSMAFFVIEPNIIENSIFGMSESLFILLGLTSFYFAIQKNTKFLLLSFVFAGLAFDTRPNGIVLVVIALLAAYFRFESKKQFTRLVSLGVIIFLVTIFPLILNSTSHLSDLRLLDPATIQKSSPSFEVGFFTTGNKYLSASLTELIHLFRISVPYLGIFALFGFAVSLTRLSWQTKLIIATIVASLIVAIPQYTISVEFKNLFFITPFFALFAGLGIEYVASDKKIKNILLICLVLGLLLVSYNFLRERQPDPELILEKEKFGKFVVSNFEGKIIATNWNYILHNIEYTIGKPFLENISEASIIVKNPNFVIHDQKELVEFMWANEINYLIIDDEGDIRLPIFLDIYFNEEKYPFLKKVFDSDSNNYIKYRVKIFEVDYSELE